MLLLGAVLLAAALALADTDTAAAAGDTNLSLRWTYNLECYSCAVINSFNCEMLRECPYETRRCMTVSIRLNPRELLVYKNCTDNCSFLYPSYQPAAAPKALTRTNSFYWVHCCGGMKCNSEGPSILDRDILPDTPVEEEVAGAECLRGSGPLLALASVLLRGALSRPPACPEQFAPP